MHELTQFQAQAANIALHKLLYGDNFYISDLNHLAKLIGREVGGKDYEALYGLHCTKWADIPEPLRPTKFVEPRMVCCGMEVPNGDKHGCPNCNGEKVARPRWGNQCDSGQNKLAPSDTRWKDRSRTYAGIALAMAEQWGSDLTHNVEVTGVPASSARPVD